jgi:methanethiol S-methyltransferase
LFYPVLIIVCVAAWGALHSWLASLKTKRLAKRFIGEWIMRYYRLVFIGAATLTFLPICAMLVFLPSRLLWRIPTPWIYGTVTLQVLAVLGLILTFLQTDIWDFIGLRQLANQISEDEDEKELVVSGLYALVRHPLYFLVIVFLWLIPYMTDVVLAFVIACKVYFLLGTISEERKMIEIFGEAYRRYQRQVPRIIPWLKIKRGR